MQVLGNSCALHASAHYGALYIETVTHAIIVTPPNLPAMLSAGLPGKVLRHTAGWKRHKFNYLLRTTPWKCEIRHGFIR